MAGLFWAMLLASFEFAPATGRVGSMLAGAAVTEWQSSFCLNPALAGHAEQYFAGATYCRPYGLAGLDWFHAGIGTNQGRWSGGVSIGSLSLDRYRETEIRLEVAAVPVASLALGAAARTLINDAERRGTDVVGAFDIGACWYQGTFGFGGVASAVNEPVFDSGDKKPLQLVLGAALRPVEQLLLALDVRRTGPDEGAAFGIEFNLVPPLDLRVGIGYEPLVYATGVGLHVNPVSVDYAYRFHPQLKETHVVGLALQWR